MNPNARGIGQERGWAFVVEEAVSSEGGLVDLTTSMHWVCQSILRAEVIEKLKEAGVSDGDTVRVGDTEFVYSDETAWQE